MCAFIFNILTSVLAITEKGASVSAISMKFIGIGFERKIEFSKLVQGLKTGLLFCCRTIAI
jgi:hypothetical protein